MVLTAADTESLSSVDYNKPEVYNFTLIVIDGVLLYNKPEVYNFTLIVIDRVLLYTNTAFLHTPEVTLGRYLALAALGILNLGSAC